jgi:predicted acyltransferase
MLSTIPAIVTCLIGILAGTWISRKNSPPYDGGVAAASADGVILSRQYEKVAGLLFFGVVLLALGWIWNSFFPFNKALWTSSFVLVTAGLGLLMLGCCYWLIDIKGYKAWAKPFIIFGTNAIALYVFSDYFTRMIEAYHLVGADGERLSLAGWSMRNIFDVFFSPINASLAFAITFVLIWLFFMWLLYRKNIYIRV